MRRLEHFPVAASPMADSRSPGARWSPIFRIEARKVTGRAVRNTQCAALGFNKLLEVVPSFAAIQGT